MDVLLIIARLFDVSGTAGDRPCISDHRCPAHFCAFCDTQIKAAEIATASSLPSSRPWKYVAGVKNCYAKLLIGFDTKGFREENAAFCQFIR
ncbi:MULTISPECIES: hypothetical protein [unclassified Microcoleus]|uniref:hypothetical protein n=1 Tax=unclassified Microcoleus TaxID=2642155 RepID=UPI0025EAF013|nr:MULTISPECIES: hypothetical protein [unclassified Microcoleus]